MHRYILSLLILTSFAVLFTDCENEPETINENAIHFYHEDFSFEPGEIVTLTSNEPLPSANYIATIGRNEVDISLSDDNLKVNFLMPDIKPRFYNFNIPQLLMQELEIQVLEVQEIKYPKTVIDTIITSLESNISKLEENIDLEQNSKLFNEFDKSIEIAKSELNKLNEDEMQSLARFIKLNGIEFFSYSHFTVNDSLYVHKKDINSDIEAEFNNLYNLSSTYSGIALASISSLGITLALTPAGPLGLIVASLSTASAIASTILWYRTLEKIYTLAVKPFKLNLSYKKIPVFNNLQWTKLNTEISYRNYTKSDIDNPIDNQSAQVSDAISIFNGAWNKLCGYMDYAIKKFSRIEFSPKSPLQISDEIKLRNYNADPNQCTAYSPHKDITIFWKRENNSLWIKPSATLSNINFTLTVNYTSSSGASLLSDNFECELKPFILEGDWTISSGTDITGKSIFDYQSTTNGNIAFCNGKCTFQNRMLSKYKYIKLSFDNGILNVFAFKDMWGTFAKSCDPCEVAYPIAADLRPDPNGEMHIHRFIKTFEYTESEKKLKLDLSTCHWPLANFELSNEYVVKASNENAITIQNGNSRLTLIRQ